MKNFFKEFKAFISRGNVFDMAVGLIIATAFNKIVSSMVNDIIMPLVTWSTGAATLADLSITLKTTIDAAGEVKKLTWNYGNFLQTVIDFLIIAFSVFLMVKVVTASQKKFKEISDDIVDNLKKVSVAEKKVLRAQAKKKGVSYKELLANLKAEKAKAVEEEQQRLKFEEESKQKPATEMEVLTEIRDLLKTENVNTKLNSKKISKSKK